MKKHKNPLASSAINTTFILSVETVMKHYPHLCREDKVGQFALLKKYFLAGMFYQNAQLKEVEKDLCYP